MNINLFIMGALQSLAAAIVFVFLKEHKAPQHPRLLALLFLLIAVALLDAGVERAQVYLEYPLFGNIGNVLALGLPAMLYLYARAVTVEHFRWHWFDPFFALPVLINGSVALFTYHLQSVESKADYWRTGWQGHPLTSPWLTVPVLGLITVQFFLLVRLILRHRRTLQQVRSNTFDESYHVLKWFGISYIGVLCLNMLHTYLLQIEALTNMRLVGFLLGLWIYAMITTFIISLILRPNHRMSLNNEEISITGFSSSTPTSASPEPEPVQQSDHWNQLENRLETYMLRNKPFLDANLSLLQLARKLGVPGRELSSYINGRLGCNFSDYIADWRIAEVKEMLHDRHCSLSITDISYACGFNSKSVFNTQFKKRVGMTPSEWRRALHNSHPVTPEKMGLSPPSVH